MLARDAKAGVDAVMAQHRLQNFGPTHLSHGQRPVRTGHMVYRNPLSKTAAKESPLEQAARRRRLR